MIILSERKPLKILFKILTPPWIIISSGCHLNRDYIASLKINDFNILFQKKFMRTAFVYGIAFPKAHK